MKKTICLNMIVKDESRVIRRCLASVVSLIDYWVIVDTGSTDGTQEIVKEFFQNIPGELHERPWVDFGHNRNEALGFAKNKADFLLFIDADDQLIFSDDFTLPPLDCDYYLVTQHDVAYKTDLLWALLVDNRLNWKWVGVAHETLACEEAKVCGMLSGVISLYLNDGIRSLDPKKKWNDIEMLEAALQKEPQNARYAFYLAQGYRGVEQYREAIAAYQRRSMMGGSEEEVYLSLYWIGRLQQELGQDPEIFIGSYAKAHQYCPSRIEPLYEIGAYFIKMKQFFLGYLLTEYAFSVPPLRCTATFVQRWMYDWGILWEFFVCCFGLKDKNIEAQRAAKKLLAHPDLPEDLRRRIRCLLFV